jgi:hypothetical protein
MSDKPNMPEHKLRQQADAALVMPLNINPRRLAKNHTCDAQIDRAWPFSAESTPALAWWRTLPSDLLRDAEALTLHATLDKIDTTRGRDAFASTRYGAQNATIASALSMMPVEETTIEVDLAMTAVLCVALDGDAAAALVLSHVIGRVELHHPFATELSASWLAFHIRHSPNPRRFTKEEARLWSFLRAQNSPAATGTGDQP